MADKKDHYNILLIGQITVGKTTIIERIVTGESIEQPEIGVGVHFTIQEVQLGDSAIKLTYFDVGGNDHIPRYLPFVKKIDLFLLVFKIDSQASLDFLQKVLTIIPLEEAPKILAGNKSDLPEERVITQAVAEKFAEKHRMPYIQISAKDGTNIAELQKLILNGLRPAENEKECS